MNTLILFYAGEVFIVLFVLFFVVCFPIIIIGIVLYVLRRNNKNRAVWQNLSQNLNLHMPQPKKLRMIGKYNDCDLVLSIGVRRSGGEDSRNEYFTYCQAEFPASMRMLLNIKAPRGLFSTVFNTNKLQIGQPSFDSSFDASCYDGQVLQRLLLTDFPSDKTRNLMGDLVFAKQIHKVVNITDNKIYIENSGQIGDENALIQMLNTTDHLAKRFAQARSMFPLTDWENQLIVNWQNLANSNNLQFDRDNFTLQGIYKSFPLLVELKTDKGKWQTSIKLNFPKNLMVGLKLMPENSIHKALSFLGVQDIEVGIKEFDDAFIVKGKNVQMAKHLLQPDVCLQLVTLNKNASALLVDDETIAFTYDTVLGDEKLLKSNIEGMLSTANKLIN